MQQHLRVKHWQQVHLTHDRHPAGRSSYHMVQQGAFARALRASDSNDLIIDTSLIQLVTSHEAAYNSIIELSRTRNDLKQAPVGVNSSVLHSGAKSVRGNVRIVCPHDSMGKKLLKGCGRASRPACLPILRWVAGVRIARCRTRQTSD